MFQSFSSNFIWTLTLLILFPKQIYLTTLGVLSSGLVKVDSNVPFKLLPTGRTDAGLALYRVLDGGEGLPAGDWRHTWHRHRSVLHLIQSQLEMINSYFSQPICPQKIVCLSWPCPPEGASSASAERLETHLRTRSINKYWIAAVKFYFSRPTPPTPSCCISPLTCQIQNFKLPWLHPASPPARLQVDLLHSLPRHLPPDLQDERTGELLITDRHGARGAGASWLEDFPVSLLVEMSGATVVSPGSSTQTSGPSPANISYNPDPAWPLIGNLNSYRQSGASSFWCEKGQRW